MPRTRPALLWPGCPISAQTASSYTKLGNGGTVLPDNALHVDDGGQWIMTRDNVTGLIWEIKTDDNKDDTYTWQDAQDVFIGNLNFAEFGGFSNWRLPDVKELSSLINSEGPTQIDIFWFPKYLSYFCWSSTPHTGSTASAMFVSFSYGTVGNTSKTSRQNVRAVRSGPPTQSSLVDNLDGTVTDTATGLMWQKCSYGQSWDNNQKVCTGSATSQTWQQALEVAEAMNWANYSDWRLPNRNELQSLVDYSRFNPAIDPLLSSTTESSFYWSSTTLAHGSAHYACYFHLREGTGEGNNKLNSYYVRAVRSGQSSTGVFGSLRVYIEPQEAIDAEAKWRRMGTADWLESVQTEHDLCPGDYTVEFKPTPGWDTPSNERVTVEVSQTAEVTGLYEENTSTYAIEVVAATQGGSVAGGDTYLHNTWVTLTATADKGCLFLHWMEDGQIVYTEATYSFLAMEDRNLEAHFERISAILPGIPLLLLDEE